jgi:YebC/PmpR family DNA-binding regulatory protein
MAGHSKWANIKHRKGAQDAKRAKLFTKLAKEIIVAASMGQPDPEFNPRLRSALITARKAGVPKDRIENSIKKGAGELEGESYEEMRYEGYGPAGVALIIEVLTDNRNRSAAEVRSILTKGGGSLGETGSVGFMFDRVGLIQYKADAATADEMFEAALEAGAINCESDDEMHEITTESGDLNAVGEVLAAKFGESEEAKLDWIAKEPMVIDDVEKAEKILNLIENLEDNDDVASVSANFDIPDEIGQKLAS